MKKETEELWEKIKELEKKINDLETRPYIVPYAPQPQPYPYPWPNPWCPPPYIPYYPYGPITWIANDIGTCTPILE
jgi:hypothetical protein